jgi:uncharacterized protein (DUF58 family)
VNAVEAPSRAAAAKSAITTIADKGAPMRIRPGRRLLGVAGILVGVGMLSFLWSPLAWLAFPILLGVIFLAVLDIIQLRSAIHKFSVRRSHPICIGRNGAFEVSLRLIYRQDSTHPTPPFQGGENDDVRGEIRDLMPADARPEIWQTEFHARLGEEVVLQRTVRIPVRGLHTFGPVWLRLNGAWGMVEAQRSFTCDTAIKVLPDNAVTNQTLTESELAEMRLLGEFTRTRLKGDGMEFESLADFRHGDDPRHIDWRTTARQRRLVVRRFQIEQHRDVVILVDCGRLMAGAAGDGSKLDRAVDSAVMLSRVALDKGDRCGLGLFDDKVIGYLPPIMGAAAHRTLLDTLYNVQSRWRESNFATMFATLQTRQTKRALVIVLSDLADPGTSEQFRAALAALAKRHLVIFAALRTPLLSELLRAPVESLYNVSQKAVTVRLLRERERSLHSLSRGGVHIIDVEPQRLTVPLINCYINLRERNLL